MPILSAKKQGQHGRVVDQVERGIACHAPGEHCYLFEPGCIHEGIVSNPLGQGLHLDRQVAHGLGQGQQFLFFHGVDFFVQQLDLQLGFDVDFVIVLRMLTVKFVWAVVAHLDFRGCIVRLKGQHQVEINEGVRVPGTVPGLHVAGDPDGNGGALEDDESPRANGGRNLVGQPLPTCRGRDVEVFWLGGRFSGVLLAVRASVGAQETELVCILRRDLRAVPGWGFV